MESIKINKKRAKKEMRKILSQLRDFAIKYEMDHVSACTIIGEDIWANARCIEANFEVSIRENAPIGEATPDRRIRN